MTKDSEGPAILVVEDDPHLRKSLLLVLAAEGYAPQEARDGEEGLKLCMEGGWACVLTDTMMPRMSGLEMLRRLAGAGVPVPPVILVSAAFDLPHEDELRALAIRQVIHKPFAFETLLAAIRAALG